MQIAQTRTCENCGDAATIQDLKLFPKADTGYQLACAGCCTELKQSYGAKPAAKRPFAVKAKTIGKSNVAEVSPVRQPFVCRRCNYRFRADLEKAGISYNLKCPYCGRADELVMP